MQKYDIYLPIISVFAVSDTKVPLPRRDRKQQLLLKVEQYVDQKMC